MDEEIVYLPLFFVTLTLRILLTPTYSSSTLWTLIQPDIMNSCSLEDPQSQQNSPV